MLVRDLMNKKVVTAAPDTNIREAAKLMTDNRVGSAVIKKNSSVVGIVTERDILMAIAENADMDKMEVKDIMTHYVIYISPKASVEKAIEMMVKYKIKKLPVTENERLVGIITSSDIAAKELTGDISHILVRKAV